MLRRHLAFPPKLHRLVVADAMYNSVTIQGSQGVVKSQPKACPKKWQLLQKFTESPCQGCDQLLY